MIEDPFHESGLYYLPEYVKDLAYISKLEYELSIDDKEIDHPKIIEEYIKIAGIQMENGVISDDEDKDIAIRNICYREIIHCFENYLSYSFHKELTEEQQLFYDQCMKREVEIIVYLNSVDPEDLTEELKVSRDIVIEYFTSYANNGFVNPTKLYYPKCKTLNRDHLHDSVFQLSKHLLDKGMQTLNEYASLGWMHNLLKKTADTYEDVIRCYYFAVCTCRDIDKSQEDLVTSNYYKDFWRDDLKIYTTESVKSHDTRRMQKAYIELSKLIFLPFLYGYDWTVVFKIPIHNKIRFDLIKVSEGAIPTPSDISQIVQAIIKFSGAFNSPEPTDSVYLRSKVDEYVKLSDAKIKTLVNKRNQVLETFTSFQKKEKKILADKDLNLYLTVFMNTITSSYRVAEMMKSGKFEDKKKSKGFGVHSFNHFLDLVPVIGVKLHQIADRVDNLVQKSIKKVIKERVENTVESFYNKELEMLTELV